MVAKEYHALCVPENAVDLGRNNPTNGTVGSGSPENEAIFIPQEARGKPAVSFQEMVMPTAATRWAVEVTSPKGWTVRLNDSSAIRSLPKVLRALC